MYSDGTLDIPSLLKLIDWHIAEGTDSIVIVGTSGESPTLTSEEQYFLVKTSVEHAAGRISIIAGSGGNSTTEVIQQTILVKEAGASASLQVVPYYNRPTQEGMYQHFKKIAESVDLPIILYNVPSRTMVDMSNETVVRLAQIPGIVGIKDATGNIGRGSDLIRTVPTSFAVYSGDDATAMSLMLYGGAGSISVTANVAPRYMHLMCTAAIDKNVTEAIRLNNKLFPLHNKLTVEPNPIPVKWALAEMGLISDGIRLPLVPLSSGFHEVVRCALHEAEAI
jgi:4-hydroxy-tetrahydrodipicolinate synthase